MIETLEMRQAELKARMQSLKGRGNRKQLSTKIADNSWNGSASYIRNPTVDGWGKPITNALAFPSMMAAQPETKHETRQFPNQETLTASDLSKLAQACEGMIGRAVRAVWRYDMKTAKDPWSNKWRRIEEFAKAAFLLAIKTHHRKLLEMAQLSPSQLKAVERSRIERMKIRSDLAKELKQARQQLQKIKSEIRIFEPTLSHLYNLRTAFERHYPEIPTTPLIEATEDGQGVPAASGIYFIWSNGILAYVGQSICLNYRLRVRNHDALTRDDRISFLLLEKHELSFAESYYIGIARPPRNFGGWKKWKAVSAGV